MWYAIGKVVLLVLCISATSGCMMCCDIYDYAYPTYGGVTERVDRYYGRVGSIYSDPLAEPGTPIPTPVDPEGGEGEELPATLDLNPSAGGFDSIDPNLPDADPNNPGGQDDNDTTTELMSPTNARWR